ncbi:MAG: DUF177 domain-containing protein [Deltaproteobacteria bacterium]
MKIAVQDIPSEGRTFVFHCRDWLPAEVETSGYIHAELRLSQDGKRVLVAGSLNLKVRECCDRCLVDFVLPLTAEFKIDFELEGKEQAVIEHGCQSEFMDTEILEGSDIDLYELLLQQYYLAFPVKILCSENCRGLCSHCGANLNQTQCHCQHETSTAFGVLRSLIKKDV